MYRFLNEQRIRYFEDQSIERRETVRNASLLHTQSVHYQKWLQSRVGEESEQIQFLESLNKGGVKGRRSRTICISDATGSMGEIWKYAKRYVRPMIDRIMTIGGVDSADLMWIAYRDYKDSRLIETSPWTSDPKELIQFIEGIRPEGGGGDGPEAVEKALERANEEKDVSQVILIADAPPHLEAKGQVCKAFNIILTTDYKIEAKRFADKKIPIHCFYMSTDKVVDKSLKSTFEEIGNITDGSATHLTKAEDLIHVVCESVVLDIDPAGTLVAEYRKSYR